MKNLTKSPCFECDGHYVEVIEDWASKLSNGHTVITPDVPMERCDKCGEELLGADACEKIEKSIELQFPKYFGKRAAN